MSTDDRPLIDATYCLGTVHIAEAVRADGSTSYWVLGHDDDGRGVRLPDHEEVGPLPWRMQRRLDLLPDVGRCGATTTTGRPCRNPASRCPWHEGATP